VNSSLYIDGLELLPIQMAKTSPTLVLTQGELLSQAQVTVTHDELGISHITEFSVFDFWGQHFRSDHFALMLVTEGSVDMSVNLRPFTLEKNGLVVAAPNAIKQLIGASPNARAMSVTFTIHFLNQTGLPKHSHDLLEYFSSQYQPNWSLEHSDAVVVERNIEDLFERCRQTDRPFGKEQLNHIFLAFLYEIGAQRQKYSPPLIRNMTRKEELVIRFATLVSTHFRQERTVGFYADALHVTPKYLTETVKEINGKSAGQIIDDFVILESKLLLKKPEYSIAQIANLLNFSDQSFFGKYFKRVVGISPKEFKTSI